MVCFADPVVYIYLCVTNKSIVYSLQYELYICMYVYECSLYRVQCDWLCRNPPCLHANFDLLIDLKNHVTFK